MATLKDIAERLGVSITTVSRVLNGKGSISQETKEKVFQVMKELDYHPNEMARSLVSKNSHVIGLIVPYIDHAFFSTLTAAVEEACYKEGYKLFLCTSGGYRDREREQFAALRSNNVAGVLVCSRDLGAVTNGWDIPQVSIERTVDGMPSVACDNYQGGVLAAQELLANGCRAPLLFGNRIVSMYLPAYLRYQGFFETCRKAGVTCGEYYIDAEDLFAKDLCNDLRRAKERFPETDGVFATSDVLAARIQSASRNMSLGWDQDFPLVGCEGVDISEYCRISTVAQPIREMGQLAVKLLVDWLNGKEVPESSILPVSLIRRDSSDPHRKSS
jgi:LacI family sucrose operon transcriptional repressor